MDGKRTTSRVTNEPGGKSSVQLGWDSPKSERNCVFRSFWFCSSTLSHLFVSYLNLTLYHPLKPVAKEPKLKQTQKEKENVMQIVGSATASTKPNATAYSDKSRSAVVGSRGVSSNAYASGSSQNTGNVITDRPTSRVTQPPGGTSSISFCWSWRTKKNEEYELLWGIMPSKYKIVLGFESNMQSISNENLKHTSCITYRMRYSEIDLSLFVYIQYVDWLLDHRLPTIIVSNTGSHLNQTYLITNLGCVWGLDGVSQAEMQR